MSKPAILITGGAKRIGAAIAQYFGAMGWHVVIHFGSSAIEAEALAASLPSAETVHCDLSNHDDAAAMIRHLAGKLDDWRVLVNCASVFAYDNAEAISPDAFDNAMRINARSPVILAQTYLAHARVKYSEAGEGSGGEASSGSGGETRGGSGDETSEQSGAQSGTQSGTPSGRRVIQITDQKLFNPNPDFFSYTLSKHALDASIALLSQGACQRGDRVYGLAPGAILPSHDQSEEEAEISHKLNLLQRRTMAEEIAEGVAFLARGHLESGQTLCIDSGQHLLRQNRDIIYLAREQRV